MSEDETQLVTQESHGISPVIGTEQDDTMLIQSGNIDFVESEQSFGKENKGETTRNMFPEQDVTHFNVSEKGSPSNIVHSDQGDTELVAQTSSTTLGASISTPQISQPEQTASEQATQPYCDTEVVTGEDCGNEKSPSNSEVKEARKLLSQSKIVDDGKDFIASNTDFISQLPSTLEDTVLLSHPWAVGIVPDTGILKSIEESDKNKLNFNTGAESPDLKAHGIAKKDEPFQKTSGDRDLSQATDVEFPKFDLEDPDATMLEDVDQSRLKMDISESQDHEQSSTSKSDNDAQGVGKPECDKEDEGSDTDFSDDGNQQVQQTYMPDQAESGSEVVPSYQNGHSYSQCINMLPLLESKQTSSSSSLRSLSCKPSDLMLLNTTGCNVTGSSQTSSSQTGSSQTGSSQTGSSQTGSSPTGSSQTSSSQISSSRNETSSGTQTSYGSQKSNGTLIRSPSRDYLMTSDMDDTTELMPSQDLFASSQCSSFDLFSQKSQEDRHSVSQVIPTLQLSGESASSSTFASYVPSPLYPGTPSDSTQEAANITSTPLKRKHSPAEMHTASKLKRVDDVIALSDDDVSSPAHCFQGTKEVKATDLSKVKLTEKRKISECNSESSSSTENQPKKVCTESEDLRKSILVIDEVKVTTKVTHSSSQDDSLENVADSQGFHLHFTQSQSDQDTSASDSQRTEISSSLSQSSSWKSHVNVGSKGDHNTLETVSSSSLSESCSWKSHVGSSGDPSSNEMKESSVDKDYKRVSVVNLEDDDVQVIPDTPEPKVVEIDLDSSEQKSALGTSVDGLEVLATKPDEFRSPATDWKTCLNKTLKPESPSKNVGYPISPKSVGETSSIGSLKVQHFKQANHSTPQSGKIESPHENLSSIHIDQSKDNAQMESTSEGEITKHSKRFVVSFEIECTVDVNMQTKEVFGCSVRECDLGDIVEKRTPHVKLDVSPGGLADESSPGAMGSPGSTASGPGLFILQPSAINRMSMYSTTSSSSAGSTASSMQQKAAFRGAQIKKAQSHVTSGSCGYQSCVTDQVCDEKSLWNRPPDQNRILRELNSKMDDTFEKWVASVLTEDSSQQKSSLTSKQLESMKEESEPEDSTRDNEKVMGVAKPSSSKKPPTKKKAVGGRRKKTTHGDSTPRSTRKTTKAEQPETDATPANNTNIKTTPASIKPKRGRAAISSATPNTPDKVVKRATTRATPPAVSSSTYSAHFKKGTQVFALWQEFRARNYYPAEIEEKIKNEYWKVLFHDKQQKTLHEQYILLINTLECGQEVFAKTEDSEYRAGTIISVQPSAGEDDLYTVELLENKEVVTVSHSDLLMTEDQASACMKDKRPQSASSAILSSPQRGTPKSRGIDLVNLVDGKRNRTPKSDSNLTTSSGTQSTASTSGTARQIISDSSSAVEDGPLAVEIIAGVDPEQQGFVTADPLARKGTRGKKGKAAQESLPDIDDKELVKRLGPIPPNGSTIFAGKSFVVTCTDVKPLHKRMPQTDLDSSMVSSDIDNTGDESVQHGTDSECFVFTRLPMVKERLTRQLSAGGGKIYKSIDDIPRPELKNSFIVTNRPCLTATYIQGLAVGVHSLNHAYIIECCQENKRLTRTPSAFLPAGYSVDRLGFVLWNEHTSTLPLKGQHILVVGDRQFKRFWEMILVLAGAQITHLKEKKGINSATVILSDTSCPEGLVTQARNLGIPIVSPAWVAQCLINNTVLAPGAHPSFKYNSSEID